MDESTELQDLNNLETLGEVVDQTDPNADKVRELEGFLVDLKKTAGVKSVKELKDFIAHKPTEVVKEVKVEPTATTPTDLEKLNLRMDGYSKEEVDFIMRNGGANAITDEFVTAGIKALRDKKQKEAKSEEANPSISSKSPIFKKYSEEQIKDMPLAELEKLVKQLPSK
jgi:hypothetical protein